MIRGLSKIIPILILIFYPLLFKPFAFAMDPELHSLPQMPGSQIVWQEKNLEVNGIIAPTIHLRSSAPMEEIVRFYKEALIKNKWEFKDNFSQQNTLAFSKNNRFFYLTVIYNGENIPADVYLVNSPSDLTLCKILKDYFLQDELIQDTPGKDIADLPRYPGSKRRLNIFAPFGGSAIIYEVDAPPEEISRFYRQNLRLSGWKEERSLMQEIMGKTLSRPIGGVFILLFYRGEDTLLINIAKVPKEMDLRGKGKLNKRSLIIITKDVDKELNYSPEEE